ncbi:MAG: hypothetical protein QNJ67_19040 [Kiloniellales bacterium]|nr:hypothetical protein [Kiloniellales bacterium]
MRLVLALLVCCIVAGSARAAPEDIEGWREARWGMTESELVEAFGGALKDLPGRWDFGGAYAEKALFDVELGGLGFTVFFQMNKESHRLQQVLLERRANQVTPNNYAAVLAALHEAYGPAEEPCIERNPDNEPRRITLYRRFPTTTVLVTWLDFLTTSAIFDDPNPAVRFDPLVPSYKTRRINRRFMPRRILIRFYPSERRDLELSRGCGE